MTHPVTGKVKKFHVVAYSSKVDHIVCVSAMLILFSTIREGMLTTPFPSPISFLLWRTSRLLLESGQSGKPDATSIIPSVARRVEDRWDPARIRLPSPLFRRRTVQQPSWGHQRLTLLTVDSRLQGRISISRGNMDGNHQPCLRLEVSAISLDHTIKSTIRETHNLTHTNLNITSMPDAPCLNPQITRLNTRSPLKQLKIGSTLIIFPLNQFDRRHILQTSHLTRPVLRFGHIRTRKIRTITPTANIIHDGETSETASFTATLMVVYIISHTPTATLMVINTISPGRTATLTAINTLRPARTSSHTRQTHRPRPTNTPAIRTTITAESITWMVALCPAILPGHTIVTVNDRPRDWSVTCPLTGITLIMAETLAPRTTIETFPCLK